MSNGRLAQFKGPQTFLPDREFSLEKKCPRKSTFGSSVRLLFLASGDWAVFGNAPSSSGKVLPLHTKTREGRYSGAALRAQRNLWDALFRHTTPNRCNASGSQF